MDFLLAPGKEFWNQLVAGGDPPARLSLVPGAWLTLGSCPGGLGAVGRGGGRSEGTPGEQASQLAGATHVQGRGCQLVTQASPNSEMICLIWAVFLKIIFFFFYLVASLNSHYNSDSCFS